MRAARVRHVRQRAAVASPSQGEARDRQRRRAAARSTTMPNLMPASDSARIHSVSSERAREIARARRSTRFRPGRPSAVAAGRSRSEQRDAQHPGQQRTDADESRGSPFINDPEHGRAGLDQHGLGARPESPPSKRKRLLLGVVLNAAPVVDDDVVAGAQRGRRAAACCRTDRTARCADRGDRRRGRESSAASASTNTRTGVAGIFARAFSMNWKSGAVVGGLMAFAPVLAAVTARVFRATWRARFHIHCTSRTIQATTNSDRENDGQRRRTPSPPREREPAAGGDAAWRPRATWAAAPPARRRRR